MDGLEGKPLLFSPQQNKEDRSGVVATSCVTEKDDLTITVENHNLHPVRLSTGEVIGEMKEVEIMPPGNWYTSDGEVCNLQPTVESHEAHTQAFALWSKERNCFQC